MITKKDIIAINKGILEEWLNEHPNEHEGISANEKELTKILKLVKEQESPIAKAAYLMGGISWAQPFGGGNKRTGFVCADTLLRMEGYKMVIDTEEDREYLKKLLWEIQESRHEMNSFTLAKLVLYVAKRIKKL